MVASDLLLERDDLRLQIGVVFAPGRVKELDGLRVVEPFDLGDVEDERLALGLADLLGQPLKCLTTRVSVGQQVRPAADERK